MIKAAIKRMQLLQENSIIVIYTFRKEINNNILEDNSVIVIISKTAMFYEVLMRV